ncbi:gamma tubulin complex Spc97/GCP2 subunit Alp4 [Lecanora helva]
MSTHANTRAGAENTRRPSTTSGVKPRAPSTRVATKERPFSAGEVIPEDSASNAPPRNSASDAQKINGGAGMTSERQTTRVHLATKDNLQVWTTSPVKLPSVGSPSERSPGERFSVRPHSQAGAAPVAALKQRKNQPIWKPQASLIAHTTAPLAGRISIPPSASQIPELLEPEPLHELSLDKQEGVMLEDLLFVFMGYEGQYIRYDEKYNPAIEKDRLAGPGFRILPGLDPSLRDLTNSVLKMATHYKAMEAFLEVQSREEFGAINHALCASISKLLKDYLVLVVQLEHQLLTNSAFTLHLLHLHTMSMSHMMFQLYILGQEILKKNALLEDELDESVDGFDDVDNILEQLREGGDLAPGSMSKKICKGGNVLRLLTERLSFMSGDPAARSLLETLLKDASRPYMAMLNEWLHHGGIKDPHGEFLVKEQQSIKRERLEEDYTDEYWEKRYTIRDGDVPPQLEGVKDKVLLAGKYLNVVRECGGVDISKEVKDVPKSFDDPSFLDNVNGAYSHANSSLLDLLVTTHALGARLRSMKHYFFLDRSDFFTYFLDLSASELKKPWRLVNVGKLQSLLDLVLRQPGTVAAQDPFKEDIKVQMNNVGLTHLVTRLLSVKGFDEEPPPDTVERYRTPATKPPIDEEDKMTGFEALEFKFSIPFPLSLVISSKTVFRYQILFRYLLSMRHLEGLLVSSWEDHNKVLSWTFKSGDPKLEMWKRRAWTLRARMLVFIQQTLYYCTSEVIEPNWQALMARVNGNDNLDRNSRHGPQKVTRTVDELMEDHVDFLDTCLKECMLMNSKLLKIHSKLTSACHMFATYTTTLSRTLFTCTPTLAGTPSHLAHLHKTPTTTTTTTSSSRHHHPPNHHSTNTKSIPDDQKSYDPKKLDNLTDMLGKYEYNFNHHLRLLLDALDYYAATETVALSRLCAVLGSATERGERERREF